MKKMKIKKVELHPELADRLTKGPFGQMISHPLVHDVIYHPDLNDLYNKRLAAKYEGLKKAEDERNWHQYVWWYERPYRLLAFSYIEHRLSDRDYWTLLGHIWVDSENIWQNIGEWARYLRSNRPEQKWFMDPSDQTRFAKLPETLTIYRGYTPGKNEKGLSWTLSKAKAEWFANRFSKKGAVRSLKVSKSKVFAYVSGRGEEEIILKP